MSIVKFLRRGAVVAGVVATVAAVAGVAVAAKPDQTAGDILQNQLNQVRSDDHFAGIIGMVRDGDGTQYAATGWGDQFTRVPADPQAQFRIGSNTKAFTSTVILQLEAEGKLSLDDTVAKWLPGVVDANGNDGTKITIRELLNHTSGLKDYAGDPRVSVPYIADVRPLRQWQPQELIDIATSKAPYSAPGTEYHYSNTNYMLAGMIIKAVTGNDPQTEVENRIIKPLGLTNTTFPTTDPKLYGNWLHGYYTVRDISFSNVTVYGPAGSIVSTLDDLATFESALFGGKLLPAAQMKELETAGLDGDGYGLGVGWTDTKCGTAYNHIGEVLGYTSLWLSSADGKHEVVVAANQGNLTGEAKAQDLASAALKAFCPSDDS
jgi:D-alanyl-D-alanine carboxypeptidase